MQIQQNTGWRRIAPGPVPQTPTFDTVDKEELYTCQRLAAQALNLKPGTRSVLNALVGYFGGEPIQGRLLVWPSNDTLTARTGLSERALRVCIRHLVDNRLVSTKDSANGKRFAIRSKTGQIIDAYGIDLGLLVKRRAEFESEVEKQSLERERRSRMFDEITIAKRCVREIVRALHSWFPETDTGALERAFDDLECRTPRRSALASPEPALSEWQHLKEQADHLYESASGGKNSRHIDNNTNAPDQSCSKGHEEIGGSGADSASITDLGIACPDALGYATGKITSFGDLANEAARLRGAFGTHRSAWHEACEKIGMTAAGVSFFIVLQAYTEDQMQPAPRIMNFGGYFRAYCRMVDEGRIKLNKEILRMKKRKMQ